MAGFFALATERIAGRFSGPFTLLAVTIALSGVLSAFLVNDVVCVALTPLVLHLCQRLNRPPIPYLVGLATASNIGSVATITGNPQNIIIGSLSQISLSAVRRAAGPGRLDRPGPEFRRRGAGSTARSLDRRSGILQRPTIRREPRVHRGLLIKSVAVTLVTVALFFAGQPIALVALVAAGVLLLDRVRPEKVYRSVDWPLLVMFAGLFVVVHAFEVTRRPDLGPGALGRLARVAGGAGQRAVGVAVEPGVERPGGAAVQAAHGGDAAEGAGVAGPVDVEHAGGEPDGARLGGEPDRRRERATAPGPS